MEKRFIVAIALSFFVLYFWSLLTYKPVKNSPTVSQVVDNKEVVNNLSAKSSLAAPPIASPQQVPLNEQKKIVIRKHLTYEFSNIGGNLTKILINDYGASLPVNRFFSIAAYDSYEFNLVSTDDSSVIYKYNDQNIEIERKYVFDESYGFDIYVSIRPIAEMSKVSKLHLVALKIDMSSLDINQVDKDRSFYEYAINSGLIFIRKNNAYHFNTKESQIHEGLVNWMAIRDRYFCAIMHPYFNTSNYGISVVNEKTVNLDFSTEDLSSDLDGKIELGAKVYVGPEDISLLKKYQFGFEKLKRYYKWSIFDFVAKLIYYLMEFLHKIFHNWGISIILTGIIVYFGTYPLSMSSMKSMKKMQEMQPKINVLKEKHKNNPQKLNIELMELYKTHKINPVSGCLPVVLQMPVFIGLYQVLWRAVDLKGADFLWIKDLSAPDHLFKFPFTLPFGVQYFNLLPILMVLVMFVQQKITAKNMVSADPAQQAQQKMMTVMMPLMLGFVFYNFASGLTLYFTMFYLFSAFTQWKMQKTKVTQ